MSTIPQPLVLRPKMAFAMLGIGRTRGYDLLNAGAFETYVDGGARFITRRSIEQYVERCLAESRERKRRHPSRRAAT
jgi:hypothetical protein